MPPQRRKLRGQAHCLTSMLCAMQQWEPHIHSFTEICPAALNHSNSSEQQKHGKLANYRVGIKDIIDVAGMVTRNGSNVYQDAAAANTDARVVAALRAAGATIVGKTTTTEFAFTDPTDCRNPYDLNRSPGGSSSGSGAAVAAGIVDIALGTQTAGSLCRPAAYCGVPGFKPSYGKLSTVGVTPLAPSFDTIGIIARSINLIWESFSVLCDRPLCPENKELEVVSLLLPTETSASDEVFRALHDASHVLAQTGFSVHHRVIDLSVDEIVDAHRVVMNAEAARAHGRLLSPEIIKKLQPGFRAALKSGIACSTEEVDCARETLRLAKLHFWSQFESAEVALTLPVPEGAPLMDGTTGFQDWLTPWTVFGGPLVCLPWGLDSLGRPISVMLAGRPGSDLDVLLMAKRMERFAPPMPCPTPP